MSNVSEVYNLNVLFPAIAAEWDNDANELSPTEIAPYSGKKVFWRCAFNPAHTWKASIYNRTRHRNGCPECRKQTRSSFPEQAVYYYSKKLFPDCRNREIIDGWEVDIYIPEHCLGVEYHGIFHTLCSREEYDASKRASLKSLGITIITIQEDPNHHTPTWIGDTVLACSADAAYNYLNPLIEQLFDRINLMYSLSLRADIDIERDSHCIRALLLQGKAKNSLAEKFPLLALEWHKEANWPITPEMVSYGTGAKYMWHCQQGHVWRESPNKRTNRGSGCPFCSGHRVSNANRLSKVKPQIARLWGKSRNAPLTPDDVSIGSHQVVYWTCEKNHEWKRSVKDMVASGKCPYCSGARITKETSLAAVHQHLLEEWDWAKNETSPWDISPANNGYAWWLCSKNHSWKSKISNRSILGRGCPYCAGKLATAHTNLAVIHPDLAAEWNDKKNGDLKPESIRPKSNQSVWWICPQKHAWKASVCSRVNGSNCPHCRSRYVRNGNSLLAVYPEVAARWHPTRNDDLLPRNFSAQSGKVVWWQCAKYAHHEWQRRIAHEVGSKGCPYCSGLYVCKENSLAVQFPALVKEWDQNANGTLHPHDITVQNTKIVGWICENGHKWKASTRSRTADGKTCPHCHKESKDVP